MRDSIVDWSRCISPNSISFVGLLFFVQDLPNLGQTIHIYGLSLVLDEIYFHFGLSSTPTSPAGGGETD